MSIRKSNRLYYLMAGYVLVFGLLASFGYIEVSNVPQKHEQAENLKPNAKTYYSLPRMELTLSTFAGQAHHARIGISLEIEQKNFTRFEDFQPRVSDRIINFLNQQDIETIRNPNQMHDFRHDLLGEINLASGPVYVSDIIFREFVVR